VLIFAWFLYYFRSSGVVLGVFYECLAELVVGVFVVG